MPADPEPGLSEATLHLIKALIASSDDDVPAPLDASTLAKIACGFASPDEQETGLTVLTASEEMRSRLIAMRKIANQYTQTPVHDLAPVGEDQEAVAAVIRERLRAHASGYGRLREWWKRNDWQAAIRATDEAAMAARAAVFAVGSSVRLMLSQPSFASARSSAVAGPRTVAIGSDLTADLEVNAHGENLVARATLEGDLNRFAGQMLFLEIQDPVGGSVPIASGPIEGPPWMVEIPSFVATLEPSELEFTLSLGEPSIGESTRLFAWVEGSSAVIELGVMRPPDVREGILTLEVAVPPEVRALYGSKTLVISMSVGRSAQVLGSWPTADWDDRPRMLEMPLPGAPDGPLTAISVLKAHIG